MNRFIRTQITRTLVTATVLTLPGKLLACAVCYGQSDSPMAHGMNWGIFALLVVIASVLSGIVVFFVHVGRRSAALDKVPQTDSKIEND